MPTKTSSTIRVVRDMGPVETMTRTPVFQGYWGKFLENIGQLRDNFQKEARKAASTGNNQKALAMLQQAEGVTVILKRAEEGPKRAATAEQEKKHGRAVNQRESERPGYSSSGL